MAGAAALGSPPAPVYLKAHRPQAEKFLVVGLAQALDRQQLQQLPGCDVVLVGLVCPSQDYLTGRQGLQLPPFQLRCKTHKQKPTQLILASCPCKELETPTAAAAPAAWAWADQGVAARQVMRQCTSGLQISRTTPWICPRCGIAHTRSACRNCRLIYVQ